MRKVYPSSGKLLLDGGLSTKFERSLIAENESPDCLNVVFSEGSVGTREGFTKLNTSTVGTFSCDGLFTRDDSSGVQTMVAFFGGHMYALTGASTFTSIPSATSIFTAGVDMFSFQAENYLFVNNGNNFPYKYNGTFTRHGIPAPTSTATAACTSTGPLTGAYRYVYTNINSAAVESDYSPVMGTITVASGVLTVNGIATAPVSHGVVSRRIYRTETSGAVYKQLTTLANNTATAYVDSTPDTGLGATAPSDQGEPPNWSIAVYHKTLARAFFIDPANPSTITYTEIGNPFVVKSTNFFRAGDISGDFLRGAAIYDNSLISWSYNKIYITYFPDNDPSTWITVESKSSYGTDSPYCVLPYQNKVFFAALEARKFVGFADFKGTNISPSESFRTVNTVSSDLTSDKIEPEIEAAVESLSKKIYGIVYKNRIYISYVTGNGQTVNNGMLVYDYSVENMGRPQKFSWVPWTGFNAKHFTIFGGNLYYGSSLEDGFVQKMFNGLLNDNGSAIDSYWWSKEFTGHKPDTNYHKDFRFINFLASLLGNYNMLFSFRLDSDVDETFTQQISLNPGGSLWDTMIWDIDPWGGGKEQDKFKLSLGPASGERIQFKFSNNNVVNRGFKVQYLTFTYIKTGER